MNTDKILELLFYVLPAAITGAVAYSFFRNFIYNEDRKRQFLQKRQSMKTTLPLKLQAYERMTLFLERIDPAKLLVRISPISNDRNDYANYVIAHIEQEYEHNLTQQIYMSDECWSIISTAKNSTVQSIRKMALSNDIADADRLREALIADFVSKQSPSYAALAFIKDEVSQIL